MHNPFVEAVDESTDIELIEQATQGNRGATKGPQKEGPQKGTFYFFCCFGRPRGRSEDSRPSIAAVFVCQ
jgi:hypothetical protein